MELIKAISIESKLKHGARLKGNVNGAICEVVKIENPVAFGELDCKGDLEPTKRNIGAIVTLKDCRTGRTFQYGLEALKRCDITILE